MQGNIWVTLLLEKMGPLCPTLARKLRGVCKRLRNAFPAQTRAYLKRREIYESPLGWAQIFGPQYQSIYYKDSTEIKCRSDVFVIPFLKLVLPQVLNVSRIQCFFDAERHKDTIIAFKWGYTDIPLKQGPILLSNQSTDEECHLNCEEGTCCTGPLLKWAWSADISTSTSVVVIEIKMLHDASTLKKQKI